MAFSLLNVSEPHSRHSGIECRFGDPEHLDAWDEALRGSRLRCFFNSSLFLRTMSRHYLPLALIECWRGDTLVGGCFGWDHHTRRGIHRLQSPHTVGPNLLWVRDDGLGPSAAGSLTRDVTGALAHFLPQHFHEIFLVVGPEFADPRAFQRAMWTVRPNFSYRLPVNDSNALWNNVEGSLRRNINRARREGFTAECCRDVSALENSILDMTRRQGAFMPPLQPFLTHLLDAIHAQRCGQLFVARTREGQAAAAVLLVIDDLRAHYYVGGYTSGAGEAGAFPLALWEAISWLSETGAARELDLYGVVPDNVGRFKKKFNVPLVWGSELHFVSRPLLRAYRHTFDLWSATKRTLLRKPYGTD